ncbi:MAG: site-specific DNA-methyltransferase [Candidatus Competibacteraceae bacterium]|nr:site-specific DNA-methyltransferase [Candidatus Competibacteraceae bacterium]
MKKLTAHDPETQSADLIADNLQHLKALFPEVFTEDRIDFEVLKQLLGGAVEEREEKYGLNWHGKRRARQLALTPSTGTLRPCPEDSVDWDTTRNLMIEGDNLEVLKLLQKSYAGKVKLIYIDPPYNTGKDFVYPDDYHDNIRNYLELTGQVEGGKKISSNTEASGRFHTDWLNMMYPRLKLARDLLRNDGVIFITIDDHEIVSLRSQCDEIFGEENCQGILVWQHSLQPKGYSGTFSVHHNFVLCYQKGEDFELANLERTDEHNKNYSNPDNDPNGAWRSGDVRNALYRPNLIYKITTPSGKTIAPPQNGWRWSKETLQSKIESGEIIFSSDENRIIRKIYLDKLEGRTPETILFGKNVGTTRDAASEIKDVFDDIVPFDTPKPTDLIRHFIILSGVKSNEIIIDFFAGSGTTGHAVIAQNIADNGNRRYILVQLPEPLDPENKDQKTAADFCDKLRKPRTIAELTKERLRRSAKKIRTENPLFAGDLGFRVFKLDSSNISAWEPDRDNLPQSLFDATDHLKTDRSEQDILFELLLKLGLDLTIPIEQKTIAGKTVHSIGAGVLLVCLAPQIAAAEVELLALGLVDWHKELAPVGDSQLVFRDSAFADDVAKTNLTAILQQHGLDNVRSL